MTLSYLLDENKELKHVRITCVAFRQGKEFCLDR
ncbi:hypothetical protein MiSe_77280 [Microseira wollei NIES-4236]|uniref:Uncharacterized protein n=1 Tax=Microseira wollei NIES-4236 TaxID=2530354 RepID=A0AAV3XRE5_9CYAN|nr:hypothetical protein MiSe_77280 [Microseira wollei NIES-4236]